MSDIKSMPDILYVLNSGGPVMRAKQFLPKGKVLCEWPSGGSTATHTFSLVCLTRMHL